MDCVPFIVAVTFSDILERSVLIQSVVIWTLPLLYLKKTQLIILTNFKIVLFRSLHAKRHTLFIGEKPKNSKRVLLPYGKTFSQFLLKYSFKRAAKPINNWSFKGNNLFQVRIQKLFPTYKFLEERCLSPHAESDYGFLLRPTVLCL